MNYKIAASLAAVSTVFLVAPASAVVTTFATYSAKTAADNLRFVNTGNSSNASRTKDAILYSTSTGTATTPGSVIVRFSFLQPALAASVTNIDASYTYRASIARGTAAVSSFGQIAQQGIAGNFSFLSTTAITVSGPNLVTHTYAAGSNLLSGTFSESTLTGSGASASTSSSSAGGNTLVFTSDFLDFSKTIERDRGLTLTAITPSLSIHGGPNGALNSFRANAGGQYASDGAPLINGSIVPEPATWGLFVIGFGMVGVQSRRRNRSSAMIRC